MKLVSSTPECHIVTATKPLVDALLAMNTHNRKTRETAVERLQTDIENGHWKLTASGIGVDRLGRVSDGAHRLHAIAAAGYPPVQFVLTIGLDPEAQGVVDRHAKRSLADALSLISGRTVSTAAVAASNAMLTIKNSTHRRAPFVFSGGQPSDASAAANLTMWEDEITAVMHVCGLGTRAAVVAALAIYYRHEPEKALHLADQIKRGLGLQEEDPAYKLRTALQTAAVRGGAQGNLRAFSLTVSSVIAHSQGRQMKLLRPSESWAMNPWREWLA